MIEKYQEEQRKKTSRLRSLMDMTMGLLVVFIGICFLLYEQLNLKKIFGKEHSSLDYVIAGLFIVYGIWRIYRGYKKDYFR
jgi:uncharacterized membrane protein HdeD (DUF308 family)